MDQDFLPVSIYTIEQKQRLNTISEEITFKSKNNKRWQWVTGVSGFYQWLHTTGPVNFMEDGVTDMIEGNINNTFKKIHLDDPRRTPEMSLDVLNNRIRVSGSFDTPVFSTALYHQSTFNDLFVKGLSVTAGLRLEYEKMSMNYFSDSNIDFDFFLKMAMPPLNIPFRNLNAAPLLEGKEKNDYVQLLPKLAFKYDFSPANNMYVSITRGYRSGGYNVQMFSELIQNDMQQKMIEAILDKAPESMAGMIEGMIKQHMPNYGKELNVQETTVYKPEYSWNYEVGSHLSLFNGKLKTDLAAFYMDTHDQQIAKFVNSGLGRMMVNAGSSESYGVEASFLASINKNLNMNVSYGYTHSTFKKYDGGTTSSEEQIDYSGNYVPFVPRHTMNAGANYSFFFDKSNWMQSLTLGMSPNVRKKRTYDDLDYSMLEKTLDISAISFHKMLQVAKKQDAIAEYGSVIALSYVAAQRTFFGYNDMADAKSLLESIARSFGYIYGREKNVRINTISQSPTLTTAGSGVKGMDHLMDFAEKMSPLGNATADECADYCVMMFSDLTRKVTMQNLYHDGGFSSMGMSLRAMNQYSKGLEEYTDENGHIIYG